MNEKYSFQICQKIIVFSKDRRRVLLCQRKGEADFNDLYSFIGGKMETTDQKFFKGLKKEELEGLRREKNEEVGKDFKIKIYQKLTTNYFYIKKDGNHMILPHYYAIYKNGKIELSNEYSNHKWVEINKISSFKPMIKNVPEVIKLFKKMEKIIDQKDFVII